MGKRSNLIVTLGLAVFIVGAAATYLVVRDSGGGTPTAGVGKVSVLVADKAIPAGTQGATAVNQGMVKTKVVPDSARPATALTDVSQLAGKTVTLGVAEGQILTSDQFQTAQTRIGTLKSPTARRPWPSRSPTSRAWPASPAPATTSTSTGSSSPAPPACPPATPG